MSKFLAYRYDNECFEAGQKILARGDSFEMLTAQQKVVETELRKAHVDGQQMRSTSLYLWADEGVARRLWKFSKKKYLYEVEVDERNVRHRGDLDFYSRAVEEVQVGSSAKSSTVGYWSGKPVSSITSARMEVLVCEATILRKL